MSSLLHTDANKYALLTKDLQMNNGPLWKDLAFLETGIPKGTKSQFGIGGRQEPSKEENCKKQIECLKQECADFASELEKAQELLRL